MKPQYLSRAISLFGLALLTLTFLGASALADDDDDDDDGVRNVTIANTPLPVMVQNPVTTVAVTGKVDTSGSKVKAKITGTPSVNVENEFIPSVVSPDFAVIEPVSLYTQQIPNFGFSVPDDLEIFRQQRV